MENTNSSAATDSIESESEISYDKLFLLETYLTNEAISDAELERVLAIPGFVGVLVTVCAGVWTARSEAFNFTALTVGAMTVSPGGALVHMAAALAVAGAGVFIFLCLAGRATALGEDR